MTPPTKTNLPTENTKQTKTVLLYSWLCEWDVDYFFMVYVEHKVIRGFLRAWETAKLSTLLLLTAKLSASRYLLSWSCVDPWHRALLRLSRQNDSKALVSFQRIASLFQPKFITGLKVLRSVIVWGCSRVQYYCVYKNSKITKRFSYLQNYVCM